METTEIREKLKCSLEIAHIRSALVVWTFLVAAYVTVMTLFWGGLTVTAVLCGLFLVPIWVTYGWRHIRVFREMEHYTFHRTTLNQPHANTFHAFNFEVVLETEQGAITTKTSSIFLARGWLGPLMEDYVNREITLAYNSKTGRVVVIG